MVDVTEMSSKEFDEVFEEHLYIEISENWRKHKELLLNDSYIPHVLLERNLNGFTEFLKENPKSLTSQLADDLYMTHGAKFTNDRDYYSLLRVIPILVEYDPWYFSLFHTDYKDEQFCRVAYKANKDIEQYLTKIEKVYVSENVFAKMICSLIRTVKTLKAGFL